MATEVLVSREFLEKVLRVLLDNTDLTENDEAWELEDEVRILLKEDKKWQPKS